MTRFLLDTDIAIFAMLGLHQKLRARLQALQPGSAAISAVSYAEIVIGEKQGRPPDMDVIETFVSLVPILAFDEAAARSYAGLPFRRARFDRLVAAHALSLGATVVTNNELDFADVPDLHVENWTR